MSITAQKDLNVTTGHDKNETIAVNEDHSVGSNYSLNVGSNERLTVGANQSIDVGNAFQVKVSGAQSLSVGGSETDNVKADFVEKVGGSRDYSVGGSQVTISCGVRQDITGAFTRKVSAVHANLSPAAIADTNLGTFDESAGAAIVHLVHGVSAESVTADKNQTSYVGEVHMVGGLTTAAKGVQQLVGGVQIRKVGGDLVVSAPTIVLGGGVGKFKGGGSSLVLNGGPVTMTGSTIAIEALAIAKLSSDLKIGP
jgi:type VI secretion system secreted protein VgrG